MSRHHNSPAQTFALFALVVVLIRLALDLLNLVLRLVVWALLHACWALEWASAHLRTERDQARGTIAPATRPTPAPAPTRTAQRVSDSGRTPVAPSDDLARFMKLLGTKDRAEAERLMALGTRVKA